MDLLFPRTCAGCNRPLTGTEQHICLVCTHDLPFFQDEDELKNRFAGRLVLNQISSYLKFSPNGIVQQLLHEMKYRQNPELALFLGKEMGSALKSYTKDGVFDLIIPVPLHRSKQRIRGYNQSERLAAGMAEIMQIPVNSTALVRTQKSATQTRKTRAERWQNVADIFKVADAGSVKDKQILLVDDVITTGATAEAGGQALLAAGAAGLSLAFMASA